MGIGNEGPGGRARPPQPSAHPAVPRSHAPRFFWLPNFDFQVYSIHALKLECFNFLGDIFSPLGGRGNFFLEFTTSKCVDLGAVVSPFWRFLDHHAQEPPIGFFRNPFLCVKRWSVGDGDGDDSNDVDGNDDGERWSVGGHLHVQIEYTVE